MRRWAAGVAAAGFVLVGASTPAQAATYTLTLADMAFGPAPAGLKVGDTIEWVNADLFEHTATAKDHSFDVTLRPGAHVRTTLKRAGAVAFYCRFHPKMGGVLTVLP